MKKTLIFLIVSLLTTTLSAASHLERTKYGPWVTNVTETGFTVLWKTDKPVLSYVTVCPVDGIAFEAMERPRFYETVAGRALAGQMHCIEVTGLKKGTLYEYRIYGKEVIDHSSAYAIEYGAEKLFCDAKKTRQTVRTLDHEAATCRFSMVCDMHFNAEKYSTLFKGKKGQDMDFVALCGDITSKSENIDSVTKYTVQPINGLLKSTPIVYVRGNHESRGDDFYLVPSLFPTKTGEFYYSFRQGPVAFIVLDAGEDKPDNSSEYSGYAHFDEYRAQELEWLKTAVKEESFASAPKKVVLIHIPTLKWKESWYSQVWAAENFGPILSEAGVDLMLSGHHHKLILQDAGTDGMAYPIVINSNVDRLDFEADAKSIKIKIYSMDGKLVKSLEY